MEKIQSKVVPANQSSLQDWLDEFKVGTMCSKYNDLENSFKQKPNYVKNIEKTKKIIY